MSTEVVLVIALVALVIGFSASALLLVLARRMVARRAEPRGNAPAQPEAVAVSPESDEEPRWIQREQELVALAAELAEQRDTLERRERELRARPVVAPSEPPTDAAGVTEVLATGRTVVMGEGSDERAREVLATAIQRLAATQTADVAVITVAIPSEEMKGRLIGRDGRNIRSFEQLTGVSLLVDDTPGSVELSAFDPRRREVARRVLEDLIADGRVHPGRIEISYQRAVAGVDEDCRAAGSRAAAEVGVSDLSPEIVTVLGNLAYRTSYGQNVLAHLVESARIAGTLAAELGVDPVLASRAALLHDLGKGLPDQTASHAVAGAAFARRHGESDAVVHAIEAHHNEVEPATVVAVLVQAADAISAARPGARREDRAAHQQRLSSLEELATAQPGVTKAFAIDAGRELRVLVQPETIDDVAAATLAASLAEQIQQQFDYPGSITVTVVRELRASAVAR